MTERIVISAEIEYIALYIDIRNTGQHIRAAVFERSSCMTHVQYSACIRFIHHQTKVDQCKQMECSLQLWYFFLLVMRDMRDQHENTLYRMRKHYKSQIKQ